MIKVIEGVKCYMDTAAPVPVRVSDRQIFLGHAELHSESDTVARIQPRRDVCITGAASQRGAQMQIYLVCRDWGRVRADRGLTWFVSASCAPGRTWSS